MQKATDAQVLAAYASTGNVHKAADLLGMCGQSVHERLVKLKANKSINRWTQAEDAIIIAEYALHRSKGTVRDLAIRLGRGYATLATRAGQLKVATSSYSKPYSLKIKTENEARTLFDKFKRSPLGLLQFSAKIGIDDDLMRRHIARRWPDEWEAVIESKAPRTSMYRLGRQFEYHVRDLFRKHGFVVLRSAGSKTIIDLIAVSKEVGTIFVQCKRSGCIVSREWNELFSLASAVGAISVLAERPTGRGIKLWTMTGLKDGSRRQQPRVEFTFPKKA